MKSKMINATIRQRIIRVEFSEANKQIDPSDLITLKDAAMYFGRDLSAISRWVGNGLPEVTLSTSRRRYTLRSACAAFKRILDTGPGKGMDSY